MQQGWRSSEQPPATLQPGTRAPSAEVSSRPVGPKPDGANTRGEGDGQTDIKSTSSESAFKSDINCANIVFPTAQIKLCSSY